MQTARSGQAAFTQEVTAPTRQGQAARTKTSSGQFAFERPGRFRFVYEKPFEQTIVADGSTLWLYDADLYQVTQRPQADALGSTPAALLASAADMAALRRTFSLRNAPDAEGLHWVEATPLAADGQIRSVQVGFAADGSLAALKIDDSFGQQSHLRFSQMQLAPSLPASLFQFQPPAGADVLQP